MMKCSSCQLWADMGDGRGECMQMEQPERLAEFFVRHLAPGKNGLECWTPGPPPDTKHEIRAALITDQDFYCAGFE